MKVKHKMAFLNPVFHSGLNFTVRLGNRWKKNLEIGDTLQLVNCAGDVIKTGVVDSIYMCKFVAIPAQVLRLEHDDSCRKMDGLVVAMREAYPDLDPSGILDQVVTCVGFWIPYECAQDDLLKEIHELTDGLEEVSHD